MKFSVPAKVKRFFTVNWQIKLVSLIFAVFLWLYVNSLEYATDTVHLPIKIENLPTNMIITEISDTSMEFKIRARQAALKNLNFQKEVIPSINLNQAIVGSADYKLEIKLNDPKKNIQVDPLKDKIHITLDYFATKNVPVKPRLSGTPREGFFVEKIELGVKTVDIQGASNIIARTESIQTTPLDISEASNNVQTTVELQAPQGIQLKELATTDIEVFIVERRINRQAILPVELENLENGLEPLTTPEIVLVLDIPGRYVNNYRNRIRVLADCSGARKPGNHLLPIRIITAPDINVVNNTTRYISIELRKKG